MKFAAAAIALAAGVAAEYGYPVPSSSTSSVYPVYETSTSSYAPEYPTSTEYPVSYTTEVYPEYTTYCSESTTLTYGESTYVISTPGYVTLTSCTVSKAVYPTSTPCSTEKEYPTTTPCTTSTSKSAPVYTTYKPVVTAGAGKLAALSGAGLAAVVGAAALL